MPPEYDGWKGRRRSLIEVALELLSGAEDVETLARRVGSGENSATADQDTASGPPGSATTRGPAREEPDPEHGEAR